MLSRWAKSLPGVITGQLIGGQQPFVDDGIARQRGNVTTGYASLLQPMFDDTLGVKEAALKQFRSHILQSL